jgi:hypothetical protein
MEIQNNITSFQNQTIDKNIDLFSPMLIRDEERLPITRPTFELYRNKSGMFEIPQNSMMWDPYGEIRSHNTSIHKSRSYLIEGFSPRKIEKEIEKFTIEKPRYGD